MCFIYNKCTTICFDSPYHLNKRWQCLVFACCCSLIPLFLDYSVGWTDSDMDSESGHRDKMRQQAEHVFHQRQLSNGGGKVVEEIEMKRQLWLQSCRAGDSENPRKTYGSAFVAPLANPSPPAARSNGKLLPRRSSSKLFGVPSEDTQNLLDDMIWTATISHEHSISFKNAAQMMFSTALVIYMTQTMKNSQAQWKLSELYMKYSDKIILF